MWTSNLIRWGGLAALVGGVLFVVLEVLEFALFGDQPYSAVAATSAWIIVQAAWIVAMLLVLLGLGGLYARQVEQTGALGLVAFLMALIGTVMAVSLEWTAAFYEPWLAEIASPEILDAEPSGVAIVGYLLAIVLFTLGWLLFGLASLQARVLPRGAAVLLMVGAVLLFVILLLEIPGYSVVFGAALAWMGYSLWSGTGEPVLRAEKAM